MNESALRQVAPGQVVSLSHMPFAFDGGIAHRAAIGLIVLATDQTIEHEFRQIMSIEGVAYYETRIRNAAEINPTTLAEMENGLAGAPFSPSTTNGLGNGPASMRLASALTLATSGVRHSPF